MSGTVSLELKNDLLKLPSSEEQRPTYFDKKKDSIVVEENTSATEVKILGGIFLRPESLAQVNDIVQPEDFTLARHRTIYEMMLHLYNRGEPVTANSVCAMLTQQGKLDDVGGHEYVSSLSGYVEEQDRIEQHARILKRTATLLRLLDAGKRIQELAQIEQDEVIALGKAEHLLSHVHRHSSAFASPLGALLAEFKRDLNQLRTQHSDITGVPTGFAFLDEITDGLQPSDMIIVAAPQSTGKTSFVLNIALHAALSAHRPIGIFSIEMNRKRLVQRLLAISARTDFYRLRTGKLKDEEWERVLAATEQLTEEAGIWIDDTADLSTEQLRQRSRHLVEREHVALIIVDYIHLMQATIDSRRLEHRVQEVEEISRTLKVIARELNIPVLVVAQLFRAVESRPLRKSRLSDLRDGFLENDADLVLMLYRDDLYNLQTQYKNLVKIIIAKHRNGLMKDSYVHFQPEQNLFSDLMLAPPEWTGEKSSS